MLTRTTETAIQCLILLARCPEGAMITPQKISQVLGTSTSYTSKIMSALSKSGILKSRRGVSGGFMLNKPPENITVLDIYNACQDPGPLNYCSEVLSENVDQACGYHQAMYDIHQTFLRALKTWTIAEIIRAPSPPTEISPKCKSRWTHTLSETDLV